LKLSDSQKKLAAEYAVEKFVKGGMTIGIGTGSTVKFAIDALAGKNVIGIPTSKDTEEKCLALGIKLTTINERLPEIVIDGADEIDLKKRLIKGGGGALTREKAVAYRAKRGLIVIAHEAKLVDYLGKRFYLPVEVLPFCWKAVRRDLEERFERVELRENFTTDNGNFILDCYGRVGEPEKLEKDLNQIPGVLENGLFTRNVAKVVIGRESGEVDIF
jgi:ribose 5-phosphate isomerase A